MSNYHATVGVIGVGRIGSGLATNLLKNDFPVAVFDQNAEKTHRMAESGATAVDSPAAMAGSCSHIFLSLHAAESVNAVLFGADGLAVSRPDGPLAVIDTTTIAPEQSRAFHDRLATLRIDYLDAPITGGEGGARSGTLYFMVGGDSNLFNTCKPLFKAVGRRAVHVGASGAGATAKMVNQLLMMAHMAGAAEALAYVEAQGSDFDRVLEAINPQLSEDPYVNSFNRLRKTVVREPDTVIPADDCHYTELFLKDARCILELGTYQPVTTVAAQILDAALRNGTDGPFPWTFKTGLAALQQD
jgi:3-hydroxyisobutyrate dehydrogenase-like beta-hydroxyacid dehydrogenase